METVYDRTYSIAEQSPRAGRSKIGEHQQRNHTTEEDNVAKKKAPAAVASMNPDNMASGGLADDFDGEITKVRFVPWDYDGKIDRHVLAVAMTIVPDEDSDLEEFIQVYSAGDLDHFAPSMDGEEPVDLDEGEEEDLEGIYALRVGRREQLNNNTNWAHFIGAAIDAGFPQEDLGASCDCFEGIRAHFNRVPQKKRAGIMQSDEEEDQPRRNDILVISEILEAESKAKKAKGAKTKAKGAKAKKGSKAKASDDGDLDDEIAAVIVAALEDFEDGMPKSKIPSFVIKAFKGKAKAAAVKRATDVEYLSGRESDWVYDEEDGVLYEA